MLTWRTNSDERYIAAGTPTKLYAMSESGVLKDITPTTFTSGTLLKGNTTGAIQTASAADIVSQIGATAVTNATNSTNATTATNLANVGGWSVTPSGTNLYFNYNGTNVGVLTSTGDFTVLGNVTAYGII
jgi:hypothetical protein